MLNINRQTLNKTLLELQLQKQSCDDQYKAILLKPVENNHADLHTQNDEIMAIVNRLTNLVSRHISNSACCDTDCCDTDCYDTSGSSGSTGPTGSTGSTGPAGATGTGGILGFADFYALMPSDNAATVAIGSDVLFPRDGPISGTGITRLTASSFNLAAIGTYMVQFQVSVDEAGQLILTLNGADIAYTVVGRATGTSQIVEMTIITTSTINSVLTVRNPAGNSTALTITPLAGGTDPVSAHLVILQLA